MELYPKKIIFVFNSLNIGGIEVKVTDLCTYYSKHPQIKIFLLLKNHEGLLLKSIPKNIRIISPKITSFCKLKTVLFPIWLSIVFTQINPALIVSFGNYCSISSLIAKIIVLSKSKFIVSEDSSILEEIQFDSFSKIRKYLVKITYPYADKIIVLTQSGKLKLLSLIPNSKTKIVIKKNWLPLKFSSKNFNFRSKRNIDILFIGRLEPQKNPFEFIDIINLLIKKHPKLKATIVGNGSLKKSLQKYIKICKLENNISIKNETISVMDYYRKSKIFLLTSVHEGFPLTVLEASAEGCIPVCHDLSELKSFFKFQSEVLLYKSITKACHNISYLLDHPCKTKIISSYYHQLVFGHQKIYFQNTINLFEQFL